MGYPGPGEYRGEGTWRTIADAGVTEAEWEEIKATGYLVPAKPCRRSQG
jgi:hypothetical protein